MSNYDWKSLREHFPLIQKRNYLATHSLAPVSEAVFLDLEEYKQSLFLGKKALYIWLEQYAQIYGLIAKLLNAPVNSIALGTSATACQSMIASTIKPTEKQKRIIITDLDFPSSRYLWAAQSSRGFEITEITATNGIFINPEDVISQIDEQVAVVALSLVSYLNSAVLDIKPIIKAAHDVGAIVCLDAYQGVGMIPLDVKEINADVIVGGMHKWLYGGIGLAFAYIRPSLSEKLEPLYPGWFGHVNPTAFESTFTPAVGAQRFQQGSPAIQPIYASRAGLRLILEIGVEQIYQRSLALTDYLIEGAKANHIPVHSPCTPGSRGGTVCFGVNNPMAVVEQMADLGIDIDTRSGLGIRVSPHLCTTETECQQFIDSLVKSTR